MSNDQESAHDGNAPDTVKKPYPLWAALAIAFGLIVLPGVFMGPLFVPFIALWAICALALSFKSKYASIRNQRLCNLSIYLVAAVLVGAVHGHRINGAQARGQYLVSAIKAFHAQNDRYPESLNELVPQYATSIPAAAFGGFQYSNSAKNGPFFFFVTLPPFGRTAYCFEGTVVCVGKLMDPSKKEEWYDFD